MARDTSTLRDILFDELEGLRAGTTEPKQAATVAKLAQQIISTAKVEMDYHKLMMRAKASGEDLVLGSMDLGSRAVPAVAGTQTTAITHTSPDQNQSKSAV